MKASQLISELQNLIKEFGDREVVVNGKYSSFCPLTPYSYLEILSIDLFEESENYQLIVDNYTNFPV